MTIAIGLIGQLRKKDDSITLLSDSQTTYGATKSLDAHKINVIDFANAQLLVAQAGCADLAEKAIAGMRRRAKDQILEDCDAVAKIAQESVREIRTHLIDIHQGCNFSDEAWKRYFRDDNNFTLMVAYFFDGKPYLFTIDIDWCLAIPAKANYAAIGIGAYFAESAIREYKKYDPDFAYHLTMGLGAIAKTIDNVDGCSAPIWAGMIWPPVRVRIFDKAIDSLENKMAAYEKSAGIKLPERRKRERFHSDAALLPRDMIDSMVSELKIAECKAAQNLGDGLKKARSEVASGADAEIERLISELDNPNPSAFTTT